MEEKPHMDTKVLRNMSGEGAIQTMDFKVADLRKKLDRVRFENGKKTNRIEKLMAQYDKVSYDWWRVGLGLENLSPQIEFFQSEPSSSHNIMTFYSSIGHRMKP